MKRFSEQLHKKSQTVKMTASERRDLEARLFSYMEYHPMPKSTAQKNAEQYVQSEKFISINFKGLYVKGFSVLFAAFVLVFVPVVAEKSIPGDVLYPVKVNFNEEIRSSFSVSPYAKVEWETERLERRISEARLLASEGKLTPEAEESVLKAVEEHSDAAEASIAEIRENDSDDAAIAEIAFESALSVQAEVLEGTLEKEVAAAADGGESEGSSVAAIATMVAEKQKEAVEKHSGASPSYEKLMAAIETETTRAYELFVSVRSVASASEEKDIDRRLSDIERSISEAVSQHEEAAGSFVEGETSPSVALMRTELSDITKLISFMTDIDVRENVTVEELVPAVLTDTEVAATIEATLQKIDAEIAALEEVVAGIEGGEFTEKIDIAYAHAVKNASSSKAALLENRLEGAKTAANEALAAISDLKKMIGATGEGGGIEIVDEKASSTQEVLEETPEEATTTEEVFEEEVEV